MTMKKYVMASLLIGGMLVGNAHALGGFSNPVTSFVDTAVDTVVDAGGEFLNDIGVDNDCDGSSVADHLCQGLGGADAVNDGISTGIQVAGDAYLGGGSAWDAALDYGQEYLEDAAYDYAHDNYGDYYGEYYDTYNSLSDGYDTYFDGDIYDAALDRGQGYVHDNYADDYYGDYYDTYNSFSDSYDTYNDQYQDLADDYDYYGDNYGRKLLKA